MPAFVYGRLFLIAFMAHIMACIWIIVGQGEERLPDGEMKYGWIRNNESGMGWSEADLKSGCDSEEGCLIEYHRRYWIAMFTALALNLDIELVSEHCFCLLSILFAGFIYGSLAGLISTLMMGVAAGDQEYASQLQSLKAWMSARNMRKPDRNKIIAYYRASRKGEKIFNEAAILADLPPALGGDISTFLYVCLSTL